MDPEIFIDSQGNFFFDTGFSQSQVVSNPPWTPPTVAQFQGYFYRDFPYAPANLATDIQQATISRYIINQDIQTAINEAVIDFNPGLFGNNAVTIFMYLAAHYLCENIRNAGAGLGSLAKFPLQSTTVGGVSMTNAISDKFSSDPNLSKYMTSGYGKKYVELIYPYIIGSGVGVAQGTISSS